MYTIPDHPDIARAEITGYGYPQDEPVGKCAICGRDISEGEDVLDLSDLDVGIVCEECQRDHKTVAERVEDYGF